MGGNMKKLLTVFVIVMMVISSVFAGGAAESAAQQSSVKKLDLGTIYTPGSTCDLANQKFVELLNASGLFDVTYYNNAQLGSATDLAEAIQNGADMIIFIGPGDYADAYNVPKLSLVATPFLYNDITDIYGITESELWGGLLSQAESNGLHMVNAPVVSGSRYFLTNKPVYTPEDFKGMKIRTPNGEIYINTMKAFNATPAGIAVSELYTSLAQKIVDGCEFPFADAYTRQLYEVVKYGANQAYVTTHDFWGMSSSLWNSLTAEQQKVINEAAAEASAYSFEIFRGLEAEGKQKLIDNGMKFVDVDIESFRACVDTFYSLMNWDADFVAQIEGAMAAYRAKN